MKYKNIMPFIIYQNHKIIKNRFNIICNIYMLEIKNDMRRHKLKQWKNILWF